MPVSHQIQERILDQTRLLLKFNYVSGTLCLILGLVCLYVFNMPGTIPAILISYFVLCLLNIAAFKIHRKLMTAALISSILSALGTIGITLFSGGINSPFIFILAVIVLGGYISARVFGKVYLYFIIIAVIAIFAIDQADFSFITNEVPETSRDTFGLVSILFSVYMLGGVFGKDVLTAHKKLNTSKAEIEKRIEEKEMLLREVHHRVKNNLQTVSSLLNLQSKNSTNKKIKELIVSSQNRVISMAMIHEMLYMRDNLSKIEFRPYVEELTDYLIQSVEGKNENIRIGIDIPDVKLGIDTAIPLGLLINEAVTNSLKYGFVKNTVGHIYITLKKEDIENKYILGISDDGIGFSEELDFRTTKSLGLKLIHNLARQLRGSVKRQPAVKGTNYRVAFQDVGGPLSPVVS